MLKWLLQLGCIFKLENGGLWIVLAKYQLQSEYYCTAAIAILNQTNEVPSQLEKNPFILKKMIMTVIKFILLSLISVGGQGEIVKFATESLSPYSSRYHTGQVKGLAVDIVKCAFATMNADFDVDLLPMARAKALVQAGTVDGFFPIEVTPDLDQIGNSIWLGC